MQAGGLAPILAAFEHWLREQGEPIEVRGPADGWRAVYVDDRLALMARVADRRTATDLDVVSRRVGLELRLRSTAELGDPDVARAIQGALVAAREGRPPVRGMDDAGVLGATGAGGKLGLWLDLAVGAIQFILVAPTWLRGTALAAFALTGVAIAAGQTIGFPAFLSGPIVLVGPVLAAIVLRRSSPPTPLDEAEVAEGVRAHVTLIGCAGSGALLLGGLIATLLFAQAIGSATGQYDVPLALPLFPVIEGVAVIATLYGVRVLRRRHPPAPESRAVGAVGWFVIAVVMVLTVGFGSIAVVAPVMRHLTPEQVAWCQGPGRPYLERAVDVLDVPITWDEASAANDRGFVAACDTAWDATHP